MRGNPIKKPIRKRRHHRQSDQFANPEAIKSLLDRLRQSLPEHIPTSTRGMKKLLQAVKHIECYTATDTKRGRPSHFHRKDLLTVSASLKALLERETNGRIGLRTFIDHYLKVLEFPAEIISALREGNIHLQEAELIARLTADNLKTTSGEAKRYRKELLQIHVTTQESSANLRTRVNTLLGREDVLPFPTAQLSSEIEETALEFEQIDPTHLFYDQLRQIGLALRDIKSSDLNDHLLEEILGFGDQLLTAIARAKRKTKQFNSLLT